MIAGGVMERYRHFGKN